MKIFLALILMCIPTYGQWYTYVPPLYECEEECGEDPLLGFDIYTSLYIEPYTNGVYLETGIDFYGGTGGGGGEFWAWIDIDPSNEFTYVPYPMIHDSNDVDMQIFGQTAFRMDPLPVQTGLYTILLWGAFVLPTAYVDSGPWAPHEVHGRLGTVFTIQMRSWPTVSIPIARTLIPYGSPLITHGTQLQVHVIGNMQHEQDGSGWVYMSRTHTF
jgi:hypothetical protein